MINDLMPTHHSGQHGRHSLLQPPAHTRLVTGQQRVHLASQGSQSVLSQPQVCLLETDGGLQTRDAAAQHLLLLHRVPLTGQLLQLLHAALILLQERSCQGSAAG